MERRSARDARGTSDAPVPRRAAVDEELVDRARYEREVASLDLSDAEQADGSRSSRRAEELYGSADHHRRLAERLQEGDVSALAESRALEDAATSEHAGPDAAPLA